MPHVELELERARLEYFRQCLAAMRDRTSGLVARDDLLAANEADAVAVRHQLALRLAALDVPGALCFGSIRTEAPNREVFHIGRRHVDGLDGNPAVVDWRAPVAVSFYRATPADPQGLDRRRRFTFVGDVLADVFEEDFTDPDSMLGGSGAHGVPDPLLAELGRARTGQMRDIVATIQAEQDIVIRAGLDECTIVQGGPGTGKTAVGLHRAAFLLYEHREQLARTGVLVVGPNPVFLEYIAQVLPSLGETSVTQTTVLGLFGWRFRCVIDDSIERVALLGDARWVEVIRREAHRSITPPAGVVELRFRSRVLRIEPDVVEQLVADALETGASLRAQRERFRTRLLREAYDRWTGDDLQALPIDEFNREVLAHAPSRQTIDKLWTTIQPVNLVRTLLTSRAALGRASNGIFDQAEQRVILRARQRNGSEELWSANEIPLIDEAEALVNGEPRRFGHVVVDEAQDLSPMALRVIGRRALHGSMTVLGDLAQATAPAATTDWAYALEFLGAPTAARVLELTIGYRLPAAMLDYANQLLAEAAPLVSVSTSARETGEAPRLVRCATIDLADRAATLAERAAAEHLTVAVVAPSALHDALRSAGLHDAAVGTGVMLLDPPTAKGLEFDAVVVVDPARIYHDAMHGPRQLFVALTRAVQSLTLVIADDGLPMPLALREPVPVAAAAVTSR